MKKDNQGKIGIREYIAIILLLIGVKLSDDTPAIFAEFTKNASWMSPLIIGCIVIIPIYLLMKVITNYKEKNLYDVIIHLFGKFIGNIVSVSILIFGTIATIIDSSIYVDIIGNMYFPRTPSIVIYTILFTVCAYGAKRGLEHIGSVAWAVLFYVKATLILALLLALRDSNPLFLFPILGPGPREIIIESAKHVSIYAEFMYLGLLAPYIVSAKDYKKGTLIGFTVVTIEMALTFMVYISVFDYASLDSINFPFHEIIRYISLGFLTNIETFFFPIWLIASFVRFSMYIYLIALFCGQVFKIKDFEYLVPSIACMIVIFGSIAESPTFTIFYFRETLLHILSPLLVTLPILLWIVAKFKGDFKHEKNNTSA